MAPRSRTAVIQHGFGRGTVGVARGIRLRVRSRTRNAPAASHVIRGDRSIQPCRSVRRSSISLRQTRGMAGARSSSYSAATRSSTRSAISRIARRLRTHRQQRAACNSETAGTALRETARRGSAGPSVRARLVLRAGASDERRATGSGRGKRRSAAAQTANSCARRGAGVASTARVAGSGIDNAIGGYHPVRCAAHRGERPPGR